MKGLGKSLSLELLKKILHLFDGGQGSIVVCAPSHLAPISLIKENISDLLHIGVINTETKLLPGNGSLVFRNCIVKSGTLLHLLSCVPDRVNIRNVMRRGVHGILTRL